MNPKIFQPAWFALGNLIRASEAESATIEIIHEDVVAFRTEWFNLNVLRNKIIFRTAQDPYAKHLYDLALGTFKKLSHTPLYQLGINRNRTYEFESDDEWHGFGHFAAPKDAWEKVLDTPGLKVMTMQGKRTGGTKGCVNVTVEAQPNRRVAIQVNDHYEVNDASKIHSADEMLGVLEAGFFDSQKSSTEISAKLLEAYAQS
ncbi:MAG: hypothetical protein HYX43_10475 [Burkholderiales bacterium]|nr:hypothetical protein [Burkholderiales bacterium]